MEERYSHLKSAEELKAEGNEAFRSGELSSAVAKYRAALRKAKRDKCGAELRGMLLGNEAMCLVKLSRWEEAIEAATGAIEAFEEEGSCSSKSLAKALVSRARAYRRSEHRGESGAALALRDLERAARVEPNDKVKVMEIRDLRRKEMGRLEDSQLFGASDDAQSDASLGNALKQSFGEVYDKDEALKRKVVVDKGKEDEPPREWVLERMKEALERQRSKREEDDHDELIALKNSKAYVVTETGGSTPAWSVANKKNPGDDLKAPQEKVEASSSAPVRLDNGISTASPESYNRGYKEIDTSTWCVRRLRARLRAVQARLVDESVTDDVAGTVRIMPVEAAGEALMIRVGGKWDWAYDLRAKFDFEARLGPPRTVEVTMKEQKHRVFKGVPTVRGAIVVREVTHIDGPDDAIVELQWGYGSESHHFEKDEVGMSKAHATALRALLGPAKENAGGTVQSAVIEMLHAFVDDYRREMPEPKPRLNDLAYETHLDAVDAAIAADNAKKRRGNGLPLLPALDPWLWEPPEAPKTQLEVDPDSKLAQIHGLDKTSKKPPQQQDDDNMASSSSSSKARGHEGDARGGFSHKMLEQFESLNKQGYTVLLGAESSGKKDDAPKRNDAPKKIDGDYKDQTSRPGTVDYSKFDDIDEDDTVDPPLMELEHEEHLEGNLSEVRETKIKELGPGAQALWHTILDLAGGDIAKAQDLMNDPEQLEQSPAIARLIKAQEEEEEEGKNEGSNPS